MTGSLRAFDVIISSTFRFVIPLALATALAPSLVADGSSTTLKIYRGTSGNYTLYDDDGISLSYLKGDSVQTLIRWDDAAKRLVIEPQAKGSPKRTFKIELIPDGITKEIQYAGQRLEISL